MPNYEGQISPCLGQYLLGNSDSDSDLDESDMFIRHHMRCRKQQRRDRDEDGTSDEEPKDESPEEGYQ